MTRVLVVDDDVIGATLLEMVLLRAGYEVYTLYDGAAVLGFVAVTRPDVIVLNDGMPGITGGEVCLRIKSSPQTQDIAVVLCSAGMRVHDSGYIRHIQAEGVLAKPYLPTSVTSVVEQALSKNEKRIN